MFSIVIYALIMELKRVSFKVAKAIKESGYPQETNTAHFIDYDDEFYFNDWAEPECTKWKNLFAAPT